MTIKVYDQRWVLYKIHTGTHWVKVWNGEEWSNNPADAFLFKNKDFLWATFNREMALEPNYMYTPQSFGGEDD